MHPPPGEMAGGDDPREAMRAIFEPADEMVVTQTDTEIAIDEKFGETRRLHPDGKKRKTDNGTSETKAYWKDGKLLVETKGGPGGMVDVGGRVGREPHHRQREDGGQLRAVPRAQAHLRPRAGGRREVNGPGGPPPLGVG